MARADLHAKTTSYGIRKLTVLQSVLWARELGTQLRSEGGTGSGQSNATVSDVWYEVGVRVGVGASVCFLPEKGGMRASMCLCHTVFEGLHRLYKYHVAVRRLFV